MKKCWCLLLAGLAVFALLTCTNPLQFRALVGSAGKTISDAAHEGDEEHFYKKGQQVIENAGTLSFSLTIEEVEALNQAALAWRICMAA